MPSFLPSFSGSCYQHQRALRFQIKTKAPHREQNVKTAYFTSVIPSDSGSTPSITPLLYKSYLNSNLEQWNLLKINDKNALGSQSQPKIPPEMTSQQHFPLQNENGSLSSRLKKQKSIWHYMCYQPHFSWRSCAWQGKRLKQISQYHLKVTRWMSFTKELQVSLKEPIFISLSEIPALLQFFHI